MGLLLWYPCPLSMAILEKGLSRESGNPETAERHGFQQGIQQFPKNISEKFPLDLVITLPKAH